MIYEAVLAELDAMMRETFEGGQPGEGTRYLDHTSGIRNTLRTIDARRASHRIGERPSIAAHARHMAFHMRAVAEWLAGDRRKRDWLGSFEPQQVTEAEWDALRGELESARAELMRVLHAQSPQEFADEGAGFGAVAHLAYHLGAIRQMMHFV